MLQIGHGVLDESVSFADMNGLLPRDLTVAMDAKEIAYFDTKPHMDGLMWTTRQKATPYARCSVTAQTTGTTILVTLGYYPMASGEPLDYFVGHVQSQARPPDKRESPHHRHTLSVKTRWT